MRYLNRDETPPALSGWTEYEELKEYGWDTVERSDLGSVDFGGVKQAYTALSIGTMHGPKNKRMTSTNSEKSVAKYDPETFKQYEGFTTPSIGPPDPGPLPSESYQVSFSHAHMSDKSDDDASNTVLQPTGGMYDAVFNTESGVVTVVFRENPLYKAMHRKPEQPKFEGKVTPLRQWSDVAWLQWEHLACESVTKLSKVVLMGVHNQETLRVLRWVFEDKGVRQMPGWEKALNLDMSSDQGRAVLATPNAAGIAKLLYDHGNDLGDDKTISRVTIWDELAPDDQRADFTMISPNLMFHFATHRLRAG